MTIDAKTYSDWGIDSLKMDGCNSIHTHAILDPAYEFMGTALNKTGRPILYSCSWPDYSKFSHAPSATFTSIAHFLIRLFIVYWLKFALAQQQLTIQIRPDIAIYGGCIAISKTIGIL